MTCAGVVLAAGEGRRYGAPKAGVVVDGERLGTSRLAQRPHDVDALVALQADELAAEQGGKGPGQLGLAHPDLALEQQGLAELECEQHGGGEPAVGHVALASQVRDELIER